MSMRGLHYSERAMPRLVPIRRTLLIHRVINAQSTVFLRTDIQCGYFYIVLKKPPEERRPQIKLLFSKARTAGNKPTADLRQLITFAVIEFSNEVWGRLRPMQEIICMYAAISAEIGNFIWSLRILQGQSMHYNNSLNKRTLFVSQLLIKFSPCLE